MRFFKRNRDERPGFGEQLRQIANAEPPLDIDYNRLGILMGASAPGENEMNNINVDKDILKSALKQVINEKPLVSDQRRAVEMVVKDYLSQPQNNKPPTKREEEMERALKSVMYCFNKPEAAGFLAVFKGIKSIVGAALQ